MKSKRYSETTLTNQSCDIIWWFKFYIKQNIHLNEKYVNYGNKFNFTYTYIIYFFPYVYLIIPSIFDEACLLHISSQGKLVMVSNNQHYIPTWTINYILIIAEGVKLNVGPAY
jgi:hypothetical protein